MKLLGMDSDRNYFVFSRKHNSIYNEENVGNNGTIPIRIYSEKFHTCYSNWIIDVIVAEDKQFKYFYFDVHKPTLLNILLIAEFQHINNFLL